VNRLALLEIEMKLSNKLSNTVRSYPSLLTIKNSVTSGKDERNLRTNYWKFSPWDRRQPDCESSDYHLKKEATSNKCLNLNTTRHQEGVL